jgi:hypothetical protein
MENLESLNNEVLKIRERIHKLSDEINIVKLTVQKIEDGLSDRLRNPYCSEHSRVESHVKLVETINEALFGGIHPENGIVWMVKKNTEFLDRLGKIFWPIVISAMVGAGSAFFIFVKDVFLHVNK